MKALLNCYGNIEINPGPKQSSLIFCHWNWNGIAAHDFIKISLLRGYITDRNFDIICLSKTFPNSSLDREDDNDPSGLKKEANVSIIRNIFLSLEETISVL